jgi:hypothetical protein
LSRELGIVGIEIAKPFVVLNKMGTLDEHKY